MRSFTTAVLLVLALSPTLAKPQAPAGGALPPITSQRDSTNDGSPVLLTPAQVESLLPATVYYRGQSAPIQLRNAAGARFGADGYLLATMVDTSGYASSIQQAYQFYLITEDALAIGGGHLPPGAYGAGVVNGKLTVMDVGGHTILQANATLDAAMPRPRPLQMIADPAGGVKLYVGRSWVPISADTTR